MRKSSSSMGPTLSAYSWFFPVATIYAALLLPISIWAQRTGFAGLPGLMQPFGHAHEMVFGFAPAVVAGFLLNRVLWWQRNVLLLIWFLARISFLFWPGSLTALIFNGVFGVLFAQMIAPMFIGTAKKWRNKIMAPLIVTLSLMMLLYQAGLWLKYWSLISAVTQHALLLLALLMTFMGGRLIAAAVAGYLQACDFKLQARVQPLLEGGLLITLGLGWVAAWWPALNVVTAGFWLLTAALLCIRSWRWQLWRCWKRVDLMSLGVGYLWLPVSFILMAVALQEDGPLVWSAAIHALTVGALGTLSLTVMARTWVIKKRLHPQHIPCLGWAVLSVNIAAMLRVAWGSNELVLSLAAGFWCLAFGLLLVSFSIVKRQLIKNR